MTEKQGALTISAAILCFVTAAWVMYAYLFSQWPFSSCPLLIGMEEARLVSALEDLAPHGDLDVSATNGCESGDGVIAEAIVPTGEFEEDAWVSRLSSEGWVRVNGEDEVAGGVWVQSSEDLEVVFEPGVEGDVMISLFVRGTV